MTEGDTSFLEGALAILIIIGITIALLIVGPYLVVLGIQDYNETNNPDDFFATSGLVVSSSYNEIRTNTVQYTCQTEYDENSDPINTDCYNYTDVDVEISNFSFYYEFKVDSVIYHSGTVDSCGGGAGTGTVDKYAQGTVIEVFYHPDNPNSSFIETRSRFSCNSGTLAWGIGLSVVGILMFGNLIVAIVHRK